MGIAAFLSLRYWRRRRVRAGATLIGVALGVALMVSVGLINDSILRTYEGLSRTLAGRAHLELRALLPAGIDERWLDVVRSQKGVAAVAPVLEQRSFLLAGTRQVPVRLRGIDPAADDAVRPQQIVAGRGLRTGDMTAMVVAQSLALALDVRVGATVDLLTPAGLASFHVVGVSTGLDPLSSPQSRVALVGLGALQGAYLEGQARVSEIDVVAQDAASVAGLERELESLLGGVAFVARPREEARDLAAVTDGLRFMLLLAGLMALVAAAYLIANNVAAAVDDRRRDLAVVRALGMGRAQVRAWLMGETLVLATGAACWAPVRAWSRRGSWRGPCRGSSSRPYGVPLPRPGADPVVLLAGLGAGLLIALVAAYPSVRSSSRDTVSVALATAGSGARGGEAHDGGLQRWLLPLGLAAAAVAARLGPAGLRPSARVVAVERGAGAHPVGDGGERPAHAHVGRERVHPPDGRHPVVAAAGGRQRSAQPSPHQQRGGLLDDHPVRSWWACSGWLAATGPRSARGSTPWSAGT